jgi:hypothetical protein
MKVAEIACQRNAQHFLIKEYNSATHNFSTHKRRKRKERKRLDKPIRKKM